MRLSLGISSGLEWLIGEFSILNPHEVAESVLVFAGHLVWSRSLFDRRLNDTDSLQGFSGIMKKRLTWLHHAKICVMLNDLAIRRFFRCKYVSALAFKAVHRPLANPPSRLLSLEFDMALIDQVIEVIKLDVVISAKGFPNLCDDVLKGLDVGGVISELADRTPRSTIPNCKLLGVEHHYQAGRYIWAESCDVRDLLGFGMRFGILVIEGISGAKTDISRGRSSLPPGSIGP